MVYVKQSYCIRYLVTHPQVVERLGLSFSSSEELNQIIDKKLPSGLPQFIREEVTIAGQKYEFYHRDIIQCVRAAPRQPRTCTVSCPRPRETVYYPCHGHPNVLRNAYWQMVVETSSMSDHLLQNSFLTCIRGN